MSPFTQRQPHQIAIFSEKTPVILATSAQQEQADEVGS